MRVDIKDFFYSITTKMIEVVFSKIGYSKSIATDLSALCTYKGILYPGLITSPILSNILMEEIDAAMFGLSKSYSCSYTRYADDLTFSGNKELPPITDIKAILDSHGFTINDGKTIIMKKGRSQVVTGLSVTDVEIPRIPRHIKRMIKTACMLMGKIDSAEYDMKVCWCKKRYLYGLLCFYNSVEPEFVKKMENRIRKYKTKE